MNILITGASRGIGLAIAEKFAEASSENALFIVSRQENSIREAAKKLNGRFLSNKVEWMNADLGKKEEVESVSEWLKVMDVVPDILVNNAGYFIPGSVHGEDDGALESMMAANLYSAYYLTRAVLAGMMERKSGHIFNMCSIASMQAYANGGSYSISKYALLGFGKNLRQEMMPFNIKVTNILPGAVYTDSWASSGVSPERIMAATDVADLVFAAASLTSQACPEEIVLRPMQGDL